MADLAAQTDLRPGPCAVAATNAQTRELTLAATGAVGDVLSINSSTGKAVKADADSATGGVSGFFGFEYVAKAAAKAAPAVVGGNLIGLSGLTAGVYYYVSRTAGRLCLLTDLNPNDPRIPALYAISATEGLVLRGEKRLPTYRRDSVHVSDDTAGVTSTLLATLHFAKAITVRAIYVTAMTVGAAGATVDVKTGGTPATILDAVVTVSGAGASDAATLDVDPTQIAAGEDLLFYYTTGASTGSLVGCTITVEYQVAE